MDVRFAIDGLYQITSAWSWLLDAETDRPATPRHWIFAGSRTFPGDVFGADADGTVICVVDFDTSLIGLAEPHSADNALLWVAANPKTIPQPGTICTLILRPIPTAQRLIDIDSRRRYRLDGQWLTVTGLAAALKKSPLDSPHPGPILLLPLPDVDGPNAQRCLTALRAAGLTRVSLADPPTPAQP